MQVRGSGCVENCGRNLQLNRTLKMAGLYDTACVSGGSGPSKEFLRSTMERRDLERLPVPDQRLGFEQETANAANQYEQ